MQLDTPIAEMREHEAGATAADGRHAATRSPLALRHEKKNAPQNAARPLRSHGTAHNADTETLYIHNHMLTLPSVHITFSIIEW